MNDFSEIFADIEGINDTISGVVMNFRETVENLKEEGLTEDQILTEINEHWLNKFNSFDEAEEWFENLGI